METERPRLIINEFIDIEYIKETWMEIMFWIERELSITLFLVDGFNACFIKEIKSVFPRLQINIFTHKK